MAGLKMLREGGNAVDAAIATAATLNVAEPFMSGIGGVGYLLFYNAGDRTVRVLNYNGAAPKAAHPDAFRNRQEQEHGPKSPMIPAAAGGWLTALETLGRLERATVFAPAIELAETGIPLTPKGEYFYRNSLNGGHLDGPTRAVFFPSGGVPPAGTIIRQPKLASTFRQVVDGGLDVFYRGEIAAEIVRAVQAVGGLLTADDLAGFQPFWQDAISVGYRDYRVHSAPPPCAGIQYLEALALLEPYDLAAMGHNSPEAIHLIAEAFKLAGADRIAYFEWSAEGDDPDDVSPARLADPEVWAQANPGLGIRISVEHVANEHGGALGPREFAVERLGIGDWPDPDQENRAYVIHPDAWAALADGRSTVRDPVCFAFDVAPDRSRSAIGVAGSRPDLLDHVEVIDQRRGTDWVVPRVAELVDAHETVGEVVCDGSGPAGSLITPLEKRGVKVRTVTASEHAQACGGIYDAVDTAQLRHLDTAELRAAIAGAAKRSLGDAWAWSRKNSSVDISPLVAVTLAHWGSHTIEPESTFNPDDYRIGRL
jgi:hypothetical protein